MKPSFTPRGLAIGSAILLLLQPALAQSPAVSKLFAGQITTPSVEPQFGSAIALSDRWLVIGEPLNDEAFENAGAVHVFDATSGRYLRKLVPDDTPDSRIFGTPLAIHGDLLIAGAYTDSESAPVSGAAYVFDLRSGRQLRKLKANDADNVDFFGASVAIYGNRALVGALLDDQLGNNAGAAYLFDLDTGAQIAKLTASDGAANHQFGQALALSGNVALIGAPGATGLVANSGAAYLFDIASGIETKKITGSAAVAGNQFGSSVALDGTLALIGAPNNAALGLDAGMAYFFDITTGSELARIINSLYGGPGELFGSRVALHAGIALVGAPGANAFTGAAYQIDLRSGAVLRRFLAPDADPDDRFSAGLAVFGTQAAFGSPRDADLGTSAGAAYRFRSLVGTLPTKTLASTGNFAPAVPGASFSALANPCINPAGRYMLDARLRGPNTSAGRDRGLWSTLGSPNETLSLLLQSRAPLDPLGPAFTGTRIAALSGIAMNQNQHALLQVTLSGPGTGPGRNQALLTDNGTALAPITRTGVALPILGGASLSSIRQTAQNRNVATPRVALTYLLRREPSLATAASDSGLLFADHATGLLIDGTARESTPAPVAGLFGQFTGRVAISNLSAVFSADHILNATTTVRALFKRPAGGPSDLVVDSGVAAPGTGGALFRSFLGEGVTTSDAALFRATLSGPGVTSANNEGLWHQSVDLVARKGSPVPGLSAAITWSRFIGFWPVANNGMIFLATIKGPGINASNNTGLWALQEDGTTLSLLRLGDPLSHADRPRVRTLQRIDVDPASGRYTVLVSLTGSPTLNQALLAGSLALGNPADQTSLRLPQIKLRKGLPFTELDGSTHTLRSLSLRPTTDPTGSGAKGLAHILNANGQIILSVVAGDRATRLLGHQEISLKP
jgi:hypothetical protein